jgi:cytidylate kinase
MSSKIIAIDGPAGSGKSSVSKQVARELNFGYLDTGAAYRALAWASLHLSGFSVEELESKNLEHDFNYLISTDPDNFWVKVGDQDLTSAIREPEVAEFVSQVARIPAVRSFMKALTHRLVAQSDSVGVVVEGRDITTVVAPDAQIRLLLTASEAVRLKRRSAELSESTAASVMRQVSDRDASDSKVVDFMTPAPGVQLVDTSDLNFNQSVAAVIALIEKGLS